jgi:amino-acid N-acetyltransferase
MTASIQISPATAGDADAIAELLGESGLPHKDFASHLAHFVVARDERQRVIGAIGAEVYGTEAMLRSFVVHPAHRNAGVGQQLFDALERLAGDWGVLRWWLLTTTAEKYFAARGFKPTSRISVPPAIAATGEFRGLCPSVAVCLSRERRNP